MMLSISVLLAIASSGQGLCPKSIETRQSTTAPSGWEQVGSDRRNLLSGVRFFSGHPNEQFGLKPISRKVSGIERHDFDLAHVEELWVQCDYTFSTVGLIKKLPAAKSCAASENSQGIVTAVTCVWE